MSVSNRVEIENALFRWARGFDEGDVEAFLSSVTEDAQLTVETEDGAIVGPICGHDALRAFVSDRIARRMNQQRHVTTNVIIKEHGDDEVSTTSYVTILQLSDGKHEIVASGTYRDRLELTEGRWRIKDRHLLWTGVSTGSSPSEPPTTT